MNYLKKMGICLLAVAFILSMFACGGQPQETTAATEPAPTEPTGPQSTDPTQATPPDSKVIYTVTVVDEAGNPIAGAVVQLCQGNSCNPSVANDQGVATWSMEEDDYKVSFVMLPAGFTHVDAAVTDYYFESGSTELTITLKAA